MVAHEDKLKFDMELHQRKVLGSIHGDNRQSRYCSQVYLTVWFAGMEGQKQCRSLAFYFKADMGKKQLMKAYIKEIMDLPVITGAKPKKIS